MAKQRRAVRTSPARKSRTAPGRANARALKRAASSRKGAAVGSTRKPDPAPPPVAPPKKPGFYEAVAIYERGVQALQRHDFEAAAGNFRIVLERYPEERELLERARLYLRVCERETSRQTPAPKTPPERVYAATLALNSGDHAAAMDHLQRALSDDPESDHAHYIMAVALGMRGRAEEALHHLRHAISLNPENRGLARQDPDLEAIRAHEEFRAVLETPVAPNRRRARARR